MLCYRVTDCPLQLNYFLQFVPLRDYLSYGNNHMVQAALAKEVLAEVPNQFVSYMRRRKIQPPQQRAHQAITAQMPMPAV